MQHTFCDVLAVGGSALRDVDSNVLVAIAFPVEASSALHGEAHALSFALDWCS